MTERLIKKNLFPYLSYPDFSKQFVLSRYRALKTKDPRLFESVS